MRSTVSLQHQTTKRRIGFYIIINAIGLIAVLYIVDLEQFLEFINQISFVSIVLLFLIWLMISIFHAWRFTVILETAGQIKISIIRSIQYLQMGSLTNIVIPRTGDFTRLIVTSEEGPLGGIAITIILEKLIDLVTASIISIIFILLFMQSGMYLSAAARPVAIFALILSICIVLFFLSIIVFREYAYKLLDRFIGTFEKLKRSKKDVHIRNDAKSGADRFFSDHIAFGKAIIPSLGIWVLYGLSLWIIIIDLGLQDLVYNSFLIVQLASLFGLLMIALPVPAFGAYEGAIGFVIGGTSSLATKDGVSIAFFDHLLKIGFSVIAGLLSTINRSYHASKQILGSEKIE